MKLSVTSVIIGVILAISTLNAGWTLFKAMGRGELQDFRVYYQAAQDFGHNVNPYHSQQYAFIYPPSALPLLWPTSWLPVQLAEALWTLISFTALAYTFKILGTEFKLGRWWWLSGVVLSFWLFPVKFTFGMGQINLIVLVLMVAAWQQHLKQKSVWAGIWLGLAISLKLFPVMLLISWVMQKRWKSIFVAALVFIVLHLPANILFSPSVLTDFYHTQLSGLPRIGNTSYYNQAFTGVLARLEIANTLSNYLNTGLSISFILLMLFLKPKNPWLEFSLWLSGWLCIGGLAWQHHFVWIIPALIVLTKIFWEKRQWLNLTLLVIATALIGYNFKTLPTILTSWWLIGSHVTWGNLLVLTLLFSQMNWRPRPESNRRSSP